MGTRGQFFIGNPQDIENREWLGCIAWDAHAGGSKCENIAKSTTADEFRTAVAEMGAEEDDFTDPKLNSFPFPWPDDVFLTDVTYAFFDGSVQVTCFHAGWRPAASFLDGGTDPYGEDAPDELPSDVPAPTGAGPKGPDSILIISAPV